MEFIKNLLDKSDKLLPEPAGVKPYYTNDKNIKSVIFDIYGTLLISASGDIDKLEVTTDNLKSAFEMLNIKIYPLENQNEKTILSSILKEFRNTIEQNHLLRKEKNIKYPEVDYIKIWEQVLKVALDKKWIYRKNNINIRLLTFVFEILSNRVYPMPGMNKTILELYKNGVPLGIISNAQFYTPIVLNYFINKKYIEDDIVSFFDPDLTVFSYKKLMSKPDESLFLELIPTLRKKYNIEPAEVLFVGNDMFKDVYAGKTAGFKTALFAGDMRSYRTRNDREEVKGLKPDHLITELDQILEIVS
jgi:putative hydrolase of the HAD superfamily